jgi:hypothetical protein
MIDITEINISTGEVIEREYTQEEKNSRDQRQSEISEEALAKMSQAQEDLDYIELKQSAIIKLQSLGLTEDEAKAIVGI